MPALSNDEFDTATGVGGRHLAPKRALDYLVSFFTLMLISAMVAAGGLVGLRIWDASVIFTGSIIEEEEIPSQVPQTEIAIVDGTNTTLATDFSDSLKEAGWNVVSAVTLTELDPNLPPSPSTLIFISSEEHRIAAELLLAEFPDVTITVSEQFRDPITLLIGTDFAP